MINRLNYFEVPAINNSFLKVVESGEYDSLNKPSEAKFFGTCFHEIMEEIKDLSDFVILDESCFTNNKLTPAQVKIAKGGSSFFSYYENYENDTTRKAQAGDKKSLAKIQTELDRLKLLTMSYFESVKDSGDKIVLNEHPLIKDAGKFYETLSGCVNAIKSYQPYIELMNSATAYYNELEIYTDYKNLPVKIKLDKVLVVGDERIMIDYKTYQGTLERAIVDLKVVRGQSFYKHFGNINKCYLMMVNKDYYRCTLLELSEHGLDCGKKGGYIKTSMHDVWEQEDTIFEPYMKESQIQWMKHVEIWNGSKKSKHYVKGWDELFDEIIKYGLFEKYIKYKQPQSQQLDDDEELPW